MARGANILLVDDEEALRNAAEKILIKEGYRVTAVATGEEGLARFKADGADLLITDLMLPDLDGIEVLRRAKQLRPSVEVIMITGHGSIEKAIEATRLGAYDFIEKPLDKAHLLKAISKAVERQHLATENRQLRDQLQQQRTEDSLIGNTPAMVAIKKLIRQVAPTDVSILVQGESGTGKEVVADILHALSNRRTGSVVKISCAAIPETLLESELFGYERGAFTGAAGSKPGKFELADGGTLFLDEIAEMSPALQAKLLRVLQDGRFQRLGSNVRALLNIDFLTAVRRGILVNENGFLSLCASDVRDYERNSMKSDFLGAIGRSWIERDDAIRLFARWLGYARTGNVIEDIARSLINGLIREGRLDKDGDRIRRSS